LNSMLKARALKKSIKNKISGLMKASTYKISSW